MKKILFFSSFLFSLICWDSFSQQQSITATVSQTQLQSFFTKNKLVKIHFTFNQPKYAPGDTAFFKGYLLTANSSQPVSERQIVNMKLMTGDNVIHKRMLFINGYCANQINLPDDLAPGIYKLIAYTDEMIQPTMNKDLLYSSDFAVAGEKEFVWNNEDNDILFFPEGGSLIKGVENRIMIQSGYKNGNGKVVNDKDSILTDFVTDAEGYASFVLTPQAQLLYLLIDNRRIALPQVKADGISIQADKPNGQSVDINLNISKESKLFNKDLVVSMNVGSEICFFKTFHFKNDSGLTLKIPIDKCKNGVALIKILSETEDVLIERLIFIEPKELKVNIAFDKPQYETRDSAAATITIKDDENNLVNSNVTVSIIQDNVLDGAVDYDLQRQSAFDDVIFTDKTKHFLITEDPAKFQDFLIMGKWKWNDGQYLSLNVNNNQKKYPYYFKGRVLQSEERAVPDSTLITFYLNKYDFIYGVYTRANGEFEFPLFKNFDDDEIFYLVSYHNKNLTDAKIILEDLLYETTIPGKETLSKIDQYGRYAKTRKVILRSYNYYGGTKKHQEGSHADDEIESDYVVDMGKYEAFASMPDVLGNIVQAVKYHKSNDVESVKVLLKKYGYYASENPVYIIDGTMTDNTEYFLSLNPALISKIKVLRSESTLNRYGFLGRNGIIVVDTKILNHTSKMPRTDKTLFVKGVNVSVPYNNMPVWKTSIPDVRVGLYWNPDVTINSNDAQIKFTTSDATGKFVMRVDGYTEHGQPITYKTTFDVAYHLK